MSACIFSSSMLSAFYGGQSTLPVWWKPLNFHQCASPSHAPQVVVTWTIFYQPTQKTMQNFSWILNVSSKETSHSWGPDVRHGPFQELPFSKEMPVSLLSCPDLQDPGGSALLLTYTRVLGFRDMVASFKAVPYTKFYSTFWQDGTNRPCPWTVPCAWLKMPGSPWCGESPTWQWS